jgi:hypothetical protein
MNFMSDYTLKRIDHIVLEDMWGIGIEVARNDFWEYRWWECELHITLGKYYITVRINSHV